MFCSQCGKSIQERARFCTFCGTQVSLRDELKREENPVIELTSAKKSKGTAFYYVGVAMGWIGLIGIFVGLPMLSFLGIAALPVVLYGIYQHNKNS